MAWRALESTRDVYTQNGGMSVHTRLWASVVLQAVKDTRRSVTATQRIILNNNHRATRDKLTKNLERELDAFRRWIRGRDGRDVLTMAGITPSDRVYEALTDLASGIGELPTKGDSHGFS